MKKTRASSLLCLALAAAAFAAPTGAQLLSYDGFGNGPLPDLAGSTGGTGWTTAWADVSTDPTKVDGPGLSYAGLASVPGAAVTPPAGGIWPSSMVQRGFQAPAPGTSALYFSFLLRDDAAWGSWGGVSFGTYPYKMSVGSPLGMYTYGLMVSSGLGDFASKPLIPGETTLVVLKISKNSPGSGITYRMYLDPAIGSSEPSFAAATFGLSMVQTLPTSISIDNGTGFTTDEIRVGTTWASVLPAQQSVWTDLGFAKPGISGAPHLAGSGPMTASSRNTVTLTNANPLAPAWLGIGINLLNQPMFGGVLVPDPTTIVPQMTDPAGGTSLQATWPGGIPAGLTLRFQYWIFDPSASFSLSASNGLEAVSG